MHSPATDQAAGLRRLCGRQPRQLVTVAAATRGAGRTAFVLHAATALAALGRRVLVIDENSGLGNINDTLNAGLRFDLAHVLNGDRSWQEAAPVWSPGVRLLQAARVARDSRWAESERCAAHLAQIAADADVVLVDTAPGSAGIRWPLHGDRRGMVMVPAGAEAVTAAYRFIKQLAQQRWQARVDVTVSRVATQAQGEAIHANLEGVTQRFLSRPLSLAGVWISDAAVPPTLREGRTLNAVDPDHPVTRGCARIASHLLGDAPRAASGAVRDPWLARLLRAGAPAPASAAGAW